MHRAETRCQAGGSLRGVRRGERRGGEMVGRWRHFPHRCTCGELVERLGVRPFVAHRSSSTVGAWRRRRWQVAAAG